MEQLPGDKLGPMLHTMLLSLSEEQQQAYYQELLEAQMAAAEGAQQAQRPPNRARTAPSPSPTPATDPCSPCLARKSSLANSLTVTWSA